MKSWITMFALLLLAQRWSATISGHILDREGKPLANAQVTYTHIGSYTNTAVEQSVAEDGGTGKVYKFKTDKKGDYSALGVNFGLYRVEIVTASGEHVYSGKKIIGGPGDSTATNDLTIDLSTVAPPGTLPTGADSNLASGKKSKEQLDLIRKENANAAQINRLITELHNHLDSQDWPHATETLQQLIKLDPNRWEFYQNLGTIQANQSHYDQAAAAYLQGVETAEKTLANSNNPLQARNDIGGMLLSAGDAYSLLGKLDEALAAYTRAAGTLPNPAMAYFRACNAQTNHGNYEAAIELCTHAVDTDPNQWEFYQALAGAQNSSGKPQEAVATYERGIAAGEKLLAAKPGSPLVKAGLGQMFTAEGNLYSQRKNYDQAVTAFSRAAEVAAYPALPLFNLCATYYNSKRPDEALETCDKAIAADPNMADPYYIKASLLFGRGKLEHGRYVAPEETRQALNKYLQLAPPGPRADYARAMLNKLDSEIETRDKQRTGAKK